jgi:hypothetical protein
MVAGTLTHTRKSSVTGSRHSYRPLREATIGTGAIRCPTCDAVLGVALHVSGESERG